MAVAFTVMSNCCQSVASQNKSSLRYYFRTGRSASLVFLFSNHPSIPLRSGDWSWHWTKKAPFSQERSPLTLILCEHLTFVYSIGSLKMATTHIFPPTNSSDPKHPKQGLRCQKVISPDGLTVLAQGWFNYNDRRNIFCPGRSLGNLLTNFHTAIKVIEQHSLSVWDGSGLTDNLRHTGLVTFIYRLNKTQDCASVLWYQCSTLPRLSPSMFSLVATD